MEMQIASVENADKRLTEIPNLNFAISAKADYYNGLIQGFKDGAKWADGHPNINGKELLYVSQKTAERTKKKSSTRLASSLYIRKK